MIFEIILVILAFFKGICDLGLFVAEKISIIIAFGLMFGMAILLPIFLVLKIYEYISKFIKNKK